MKDDNPHLKTHISVGGGTASKEFPDVARNPVSRQTLASELRLFCDEHGFDGVDSTHPSPLAHSQMRFTNRVTVDWEHPTSTQQGSDFIQLLRDLRHTLPDDDFLITTALPAAEYCLRNINLVHLSQCVDFLNLMSYDFTGSWGEVAGHHAQLFARDTDVASCHPALRACGCDGTDYVLSQGFPSSKILLGVPVYARYFPRACCPGESNEEAGEMEYKDIPDDWVLEATVDEEHGTSSYLDESQDGKGFVSFDSPGTVKIKASFVHTMTLGGLFYWTGSADKEGELSLVSSGARELRCRSSQL